jgi:ligand-binding sensor domain-containing protein
MPLRFFGILVLFLSIPLAIFSQGRLFVEEYTPETYENFRQNWSISQDNSGYIYVGNTDGLVIYNGSNWKSLHAPRGGIIRYVFDVEDNVFWGGRSDFGRIASDSVGDFYLESFKSRIDSSHLNFSDILRIRKHQDDLLFYSNEAIFNLTDEEIDVIGFDTGIEGVFKVDNQVIVKTNDRLAYLLDEGISQTIDSANILSDDRLYVVLPFNDEHLFIFREQGFMLFDGKRFRPFQTEAADYVKEHLIFRGTYINDNQIALATLTGGIIIINTDGSLHTILTEEDGLPTNIIYGLYVDREETLWIATDNGIAKVLVNNPVTKLDERSGFGGIPTFIGSVGSTTYFGSTEGLFYSEGVGRLTKTTEINNRVYDGIISGNEIVTATPEGLYRITEDEIDLLTSSEFLLLESSDNDADLFFGATNDSVYAIKKAGDQVEEMALTAALGYVRDLYNDRDELWVVTAENGISRYSRDGSLIKKYEISLSEDQEAHRLDVLGGRLRLGTDAGLFVHSPRADTFVVDTTFQHRELTVNQVNRFRQCAENEIWLRNNRKIKRAVYDSGQWNVIEDPFRLIDDGEMITTIYCGEDNDIWFGGTAGINHLSDPDWEYDYEFNTNITGLLVRNDSLVYGGYGEPDSPLELAYADNELRFTYAAASYIAPEENTYRTRLRGYDDGWSSWTSEKEKDYTLIPEGTYTFEVQGRNIYHKAGTIDSFTFTILPPWYRTWWAYTLYTLFFGGLIYGGHKLRINQILREQRIRNRIASDLHDEVSATLSSITYFAQAIRQMQNGQETERFVELISESAFEAKEKITDIIWSIDPDNDDWINLLSKCRRFASDLFESKGIDYELDIDSDIDRPLDVELRQHLWLIFKEMVVNAARHSKAKKVVVFFGLEGNQLKLMVQDNGIGIPDDFAQKSGHGIKNIKKRARQLGAELNLKVDPEIGTRWIILLEI